MYFMRKKFLLTYQTLVYLMIALPMGWLNEQTFLALIVVVLGMYKVADVTEKRIK